MAVLDFAARVFRDWETYGVPASGPHDPVKAEIRALFAQVVTLIGVADIPAGLAQDISAIAAQIEGIATDVSLSQEARDDSIAAAAAALAAKVLAETAAGVAEDARDDALAYAELTGPFLFYATKAEANAALAGLPANQLVQVWADESQAGVRTVYKKVGGVYVLQASLSYISPAALAAAGGSALVGFDPGLAGDTLRTAQDKLREFISVADFAGADDMAKLEAAAAAVSATGGTLYIPPAGIDISEAVNIPAVNIDAAGPIRMVDTGAITMGEAVSAIPDLAADIAAGDYSAEFVTAHGLTPGSVFGVHNQTDGSFSPARDEYQDGQRFRVIEAPTSTTVRFEEPAKRLFDKDLVDCFVLNSGSAFLKNIHIDPTGSTAEVLFLCDGVNSLQVSNMTCGRGATRTVLQIHRCFAITVQTPALQSHDELNDTYPLIMSNSGKYVIFAGANQQSSRHAVAHGGGSGLGCIPNADGKIIGGIFSNDPVLGVGSAEAHGNCEDIIYTACDMHGGFNPGGRNIRAIDCRITGRDPALFPDGLCVNSVEVTGGDIVLDRADIVTAGNGDEFGIIFLSLVNLAGDVRIFIRNPRMIYNGTTIGDVRLVQLEVGPDPWSGHKIEVFIEDPDWPRDLAGPFTALVISGLADVSADLFVTYRGADRFPAGTQLIAATLFDNTTCRLEHDLTMKGTTANRPGFPTQGQMYLDTTLDADGKPIWYTGAAWVDATGAVVA